MMANVVRDGAKGTIVSFTVINVATPEFADQAPYGLAIIQLDGGGGRVLARIKDGSAESMTMNAPVEFDHTDDHGAVFRLV
jgi:uncharacterized OB-fold protein